MQQFRSLMKEDSIVLFSTLLSDNNIKPGQRLSWWYASPRNGHISLFSKKSLQQISAKNELRLGHFSQGFHMLFNKIPRWGAHLISQA